MKKLLALLLALVMVVGLVACGAADAPAAEAPKADAPVADAPAADAPAADAPAADKKVKVGLISFNEATESSALIANGVREAAEKYGVELVTADINGDQSQVIKNVDLLIQQEVDAIIDATWNADVGATAAQKCRDAGVILIACDCLYDDVTHMVGADNYTAGQVIGAYMADYVKANWNGEVDYLVIVNEEAAGETTQLRMGGGIDALKAAGIDIPDDKIFWFDSMGQMLKAKEVTTDFLTAHPDGEKILIDCLNDESGLGSLAAVQSSGREDDCLIYSYGGEPSSAANFKKEDNCWIATVNFNLPKYGELAMATIFDLLEGKDRPLEQSPDLGVIDRSNVLEFYPD